MSRREKFRLHEVPPVQFLLYVLLRVVVAVVDMVPYGALPAAARVVGRLVRWVDRKHVRIARKNLGKTPDVCAERDIPGFISRVYDHVGLGFAEMLKLHRLLRYHEVSRYVRLVDFDILARCAREGRGVLIGIGHLGNWEVGGLAVTLSGFPIQSLARPLANPWVDRYLNRFRSQAGQRVIPRDRALASMIRILVGGGLLVIQIDQDARDLGVSVNFFGRPASTHRAPATLSLKYNAPVVMVNTYREGSLNYAVCSEPFYPDAFRSDPEPVRALTQALSDRFEGFVRQHPDQWFWMHDRWKSAERAARAAARTAGA